MFQIGESVLYGIHGVCDIIGSEEQTVNRKHVTYLILEPVGQPGSRYMVPMHNAAAMGKLKRMLTREELECMMRSEQVYKDCWIQDEGQRKQKYRELINSGEREKLMGMVHTLYGHKAELAAAGRKIHLCDDNFLRDAEKILMGEISVIMNMDMDEAKQFIRTALKNP